MALSPNVGSVARGVASGQTFVHFRFNESDINGLVSDLNYATTPAVVQSAARVREYGENVLEYLKRRFPSKGSGTGATTNLRAGWRVKFYSGATRYAGTVASTASLWGFYIEHRRQRSERVSTILNSLEFGSRAYTIRPTNGKALLVPKAYPARGGSIFATKADIPSRKGYGFMQSTAEFADRLLVKHGSLLEDEMHRIIEKGARLKQLQLGATSSSGDVLEAAAEAPEVISALAKQKNPLKALARLKQRNKSRKLKVSR